MTFKRKAKQNRSSPQSKENKTRESGTKERETPRHRTPHRRNKPQTEASPARAGLAPHSVSQSTSLHDSDDGNDTSEINDIGDEAVLEPDSDSEPRTLRRSARTAQTLERAVTCRPMRFIA